MVGDEAPRGAASEVNDMYVDTAARLRQTHDSGAGKEEELRKCQERCTRGALKPNGAKRA